MSYPFDRKLSLGRALCVTVAGTLVASMLAGCDLLPSGGNKETTENTSISTSAPTVTETTETTEPVPTIPATAATTPVPQKKENSAVVKEQLKVRASPSTASRVITQLDAGDEVEVIRIEPIGAVEWAYVSSDTLNVMGWIVTDMLDMSNVTLSSGTTGTPANADSTEGTVGSGTIATAPSTTATTPTVNSITGTGTQTGGQMGVVMTDNLNIRSSASTNGDRVGSYNYGDRISILEENNGWGRTNKGWVSLSYVYKDGSVGTRTATATITASQLNVRSGPGTGYDKVKSLSQGDVVNILEQVTVGNDTWGYVSGGWISMQYTNVTGTNTVAPSGNGTTGTPSTTGSTGTVTAQGGLNIRSSAGTNSTVVGGYTYGAAIQILETTVVDGAQWGRTPDGWVFMQYVRVN